MTENCRVNDCQKRPLVGEIERLRKALETAAGRFNMMAGVGLVNGADPKVGYRECMDALRPVGNAPERGNE